MDKTPISIALERQIPEFIREEYSVFVDFVKAYYAFLDQTQQRNLEDIRSIENTLDEFVIRFKKELSVIFPTDSLQNERFILQRIREFYKTRGSVQSFQFLFRALFNKEAEIYYPSKQILRASDGSWVQEKSVFVQSTSGNLFDLAGKIIDINTTSKTIHIFAPRVVYYRENIYEIFIERSYYQDLSIGDTISSTDGSISGEIIPCPTKYSIVSGGAGFEIGALYHLPTESGRGSLIKVTRIDSDGAIKKIQIISFGLDYPAVFYAQLSNKTRQAIAYYTPITSFIMGVYTEKELVDGVLTDVVKTRPAGLSPTESYTNTKLNPNGTTDVVPYADGTTGSVDLGYINKQDYFAYDIAYLPDASIAASQQANEKVFYADGTYVGEIIGSFYTNNANANVIDSTTAEIKIELGPVAVYPGYYSKSDGFISDEIYIQDGKYYQLFSYVVKVEQQVDSYRDIIKALLHPAGFEMFAEYNVKNTYLLSASALYAFIRRQFTDQEYITDDSGTKDITKLLQDVQTTYTNSNTDIKDVIKRLDETPLPLEFKYYDMFKGSDIEPIENSLTTAVSDFNDVKDTKNTVKKVDNFDVLTIDLNTLDDKKAVVKGYDGNPIENSLTTAASDFNTAIDTKAVVKGYTGNPIEDSLTTASSNFDTLKDTKDVVKGSASNPIEDSLTTASSNFDTLNDKKDVVKGSASNPIEKSLTTASSNFDTLNDAKIVVKGYTGNPIEDSLTTASSNFDTVNDAKIVVKGYTGNPIEDSVTGTTIDTIGDRSGAGKGFVTYVRNTSYIDVAGLYPFANATTSAESIGDRNGDGKGSVSYVRNTSYIDFNGTYPFVNAIAPGELYKSLFTPGTKTDTYTCVAGGWSWNGSSYILNTPEIIIRSNYYRMPDLLGFAATLVAGTDVVNLTYGTTHGIFEGSELLVTSGTGAFGASVRIKQIINTTQFTTTVNHATAGSITFKTIGNTPQLAEALSSPTDAFPTGSTPGLVKFAFSGSSWSDGVTSAQTVFNSIAVYNRSFAEAINNTSTGILYYNAYNQNSTDPASSYSYEAEVYSVHDTRAIS